MLKRSAARVFADLNNLNDASVPDKAIILKKRGI